MLEEAERCCHDVHLTAVYTCQNAFAAGAHPDPLTGFKGRGIRMERGKDYGGKGRKERRGRREIENGNMGEFESLALGGGDRRPCCLEKAFPIPT